MSSTPSEPQSPPALHIQLVENFGQWFDDFGRSTQICTDQFAWNEKSWSSYGMGNKQLAFVRTLYDKKIGEVGCYWRYPHVPIDFKHANVKFGDLFDFYTRDGVLRIPTWFSMKYAVDEFLAEDPRTKFHPLRVQQFINEHGIDQLELME